MNAQENSIKMSNEAVEGNEDTEQEENEENFSTPVGCDEELKDDIFVGFVGAVEIAVEDAMSSENRDEWEDAIIAEITSSIKNNTWDIVKRPENHNIVGSRLVLTNKYRSDGTIERRKARILAKGYSQCYGVDYYDTFARVARLESIRLMMALSVELGLKIQQIDITTAYLNGYLDEKVIMKVPEMLKDMLQKIIRKEGDQTEISIQAGDMLTKLNAGGNA